jgi:hypothetical protein
VVDKETIMIKKSYIDATTMICLLIFVRCANRARMSDDIEGDSKKSLKRLSQPLKAAKEGFKGSLKINLNPKQPACIEAKDGTEKFQGEIIEIKNVGSYSAMSPRNSWKPLQSPRSFYH